MVEAETSVIQRGTWLYNGSVRLSIRIELSQIRYGTADEEDEPDTRDDVDTPTFVLWFETSSGPPRWVRGGQYSSLEEAMENAERAIGESLIWD